MSATKDSLTRRLENKIHADIPISNHMGFEIESIHDEGARCRLPLTPNTNHLGTQFGGSLYAAGALCCYSALLGLLARLGLESKNIVITDGHIEYLAPGTGDVVLEATLPALELRDFESKLRFKGRARLKVETHVLLAGSMIAKVRGEYLVRSEKIP